MSTPINIYTRSIDPAGVARLLRDLVPNVKFDGPDDNWLTATFTLGTFLKKKSVKINHDRAFYEAPEWQEHLQGMQGYFNQFPETERKQRALLLISTFRFSLPWIFTPAIESDDDPRYPVLEAVTKYLDGVQFVPGYLLDADSRVLYGCEGEDDEDADAVWPRVFGSVPLSDPLGVAMHAASGPVNEDQNTEEAPDANRVAKRALALAVITDRGMVDTEPDSDGASEHLESLREWATELRLEGEFESEELGWLATPVGELAVQDRIDSIWRLEGLAILAWALGRCEIPPHDELVNPQELWRTIGLFEENAGGLLAHTQLRTRDEIKALHNQIFALHWRLKNYFNDRKVMDFAEFAKSCWFGPLDISGLPLVDGDLALRGERLDRVFDTDVFQFALSAAKERHQAVNWLWEGPALYSDALAAT